MKSSEIADVQEIENLETLKVLADPLRVQILELLIADRLTVKQIAQRLGLSPSKLYYHVNQMEQNGLIKVVDTRMVSGIVEKHYRAVAKQLHIKHELLSTATPEGRESVNTAIKVMIDSTRDDILRTIEARQYERDQGAPPQPREALVTRHRKRLPKAEAADFRRRLQELTKDFDDAPEAGPEEHSFGMLVAFYPSFYFPEDDSNNDS